MNQELKKPSHFFKEVRVGIKTRVPKSLTKMTIGDVIIPFLIDSQ